MSERFTRLFSLENNLYTDGSPLIISAGALLRDNEKSGVLAQIKYKNICEKTIKSINVEITMLDGADRELTQKVSHTYLDLDLMRDAEIGQKEPISLPDSTSRAFKVAIREVVFSDKTVWSSVENDWFALPDSETVADRLKKYYLAEQYTRDCGKFTQFVPTNYGDIWLCTCGKFNMKNEDVCHSCRLELDEQIEKLDTIKLSENFKKYNYSCAYSEAEQIMAEGKRTDSIEKIQDAIKEFEKIKEYKDSCEKISECEILIEEIRVKREREKEEIEQKKKRTIKTIKKISILLSVLAVIIVTSVFIYNKCIYNKYILPKMLYKEALDFNETKLKEIEMLLKEEEYYDCIDVFNNLDRFNTSRNFIPESIENLNDKRLQVVEYLLSKEDYGSIRNFLYTIKDTNADFNNLYLYSEAMCAGSIDIALELLNELPEDFLDVKERIDFYTQHKGKERYSILRELYSKMNLLSE